MKSIVRETKKKDIIFLYFTRNNLLLEVVDVEDFCMLICILDKPGEGKGSFINKRPFKVSLDLTLFIPCVNLILFLQLTFPTCHLFNIINYNKCLVPCWRIIATWFNQVNPPPSPHQKLLPWTYVVMLGMF